MNITLTPSIEIRVDLLDGSLRGLLYRDGLKVRGVVSVSVDFARRFPSEPMLSGTVVVVFLVVPGRGNDTALIEELERLGVEVDLVTDEKYLAGPVADLAD